MRMYQGLILGVLFPLAAAFLVGAAIGAPVDYSTKDMKEVQARRKTEKALKSDLAAIMANVTNAQAMVKSLEPSAFPAGKEREFARTTKQALEEIVQALHETVRALRGEKK